MDDDDDYDYADYDDIVLSPQVSNQTASSHPINRPMVYSQWALFDLLYREIKQKVIELYPDVTMSQSLGVLLQNNFRLDQLRQKLCSWTFEHLSQHYSLPQEHNSTQRNCEICLNVESGNQTTCCDGICLDCLNGYLKEEILKGEVLIKCPSELCHKIIYHSRMPHSLRQRYEEKVGVKYCQSIPKSFLRCWDCEKYIKVPMYQRLHFIPCEEECSCRMCLQCEKLSHRPLPCDKVKQWTGKVMEQGLSNDYIVKNTKKCPNCKVDIYKDGGCNHMTCKKCNYEYCWICMGNWKLHCQGKIKCVVYVPAGSNELELDRNKFIFYATRYMEFEQSEDVAFKMRNKLIKQKMEILENALQKPRQSFQFLRNGLNCIIQSRRAIKYLYAFLCMEKIDKGKKEIIEHNLGTAQVNLEHLHGLIESVLGVDTVGEWEQYHQLSFQIKNYSSATDKFLQNITEEFEDKAQ